MAELLRGDVEEEGDATRPRIPGRCDAAPNPGAMRRGPESRDDEILQPEHAGRRRDAVTVWHSNHS
jgi:hypothetical protein